MTVENFYEAELRDALKNEFSEGTIRSIGDSAAVFKKLASIYPAYGSKIDWDQVPESIQFFEERDNVQVEMFGEFFDKMVKMFSLYGDVIYVGDSATDFALQGSVETIKAVLPKLASIPQHHYFIDSGYSWCMCLTMEGDMGFGFGAMKGKL